MHIKKRFTVKLSILWQKSSEKPLKINNISLFETLGHFYVTINFNENIKSNNI